MPHHLQGPGATSGRTARTVVLVGACLLACLPAARAAAAERTVRVGLFQVEPLLFGTPAAPEGLNVDLLEHVAAAEGWRLQFVAGTWEEQLDRLARGTIDVLPCLARSAARDSFADFTREPVMTLWSQVFVRPGDSVSNVLDLSGRRVAVMRGDINGDQFRQYAASFGLHCSYVEVPSLDDVFALVAAGEAAAGVAPNVFGYLRAGVHGLRPSPVIFAPFEIHFGVPAGRDQDVLRALDAALAAWHAEPVSYVDERLQHWFGGEDLSTRPAAPRWLLMALAGVGIVAILLVMWVRMLDHQVRSRTADLRRSEQRYRTLFEAAADAIFIMHDGRFVDCNRATLAMFRARREDIIGRRPEELSPDFQPDGRESAVAAAAHLAAVAEGPASAFEWQHLRLDGTLMDAEVTLTSFVVDGRPVVQAMVRDVTERKELEANLRQAQKMEAIGTLAGGIAHDFNNILAAILGYGELARLDAAPDTELRANLDHVLRAGERARDLVQQILAFSRRTMKSRRAVALAPVVDETLQLLRSSLPANITIAREVAGEGPVLADPTGLYQVLMNLCTNAFQAMERTGGELGVRLHERDRPDDPDGQAGPQVVLEVRDTGPGMDAATRAKIFEPYFTTKEAERGTGLGLAVVHGIVQELGGRIEVESAPGEGALFRVVLPRHVAGEAAAGDAAPPSVRGTERVLFVDDEPAIVDACRQGLERLGYRVTGHTEPGAALAALRTRPDGWDVLVTDMSMPGMSGLALAAAARELRRDLPVVLTTGYADGITAEEARRLGVASFLIKPAGMERLAGAVRSAVAAPVAGPRP